jgi:AcrR family transcriptional regulator
MAGRARLPIDERRAQLLKLGRKVFGERPYDTVSIDDLAARLGVSKGLLYHYFPSKKRFYLESLRAAAAELIERTAPRVLSATIEDLRLSLDAFIEYVEENAAGYRALMRSGVGHDPKVAAILEGVRRAMVDRVLTSLGMPEPPPLVRLALRGWIGFVEETSLDWAEHRDAPREALRELLVEALVSAMASSRKLLGQL